MSRLPLPVDPRTVIDFIPDGADVVVGLANGEPTLLMDTIEELNEELRGVRFHQMHSLHDRPYLHGAYADRMRQVCYFMSHINRAAYYEGTIDVVPAHFSEVPLMLRRFTRRNLAIGVASLPDKHGYFSLGVDCGYMASMIGRVPMFLEASSHVPHTHGANLVHHSQIVGWCESDRHLVEVPMVEPKPLEKVIASYVTERIPNGATIQVGIGGIANAILDGLHDHHNLGVHTELFHDGMADLVDAGVITGAIKERRRNRSVTTFSMGTQRLYEWLDNNPAVEFLGVEFCNDPRIIAEMSNFVSVNATTEVDLMGQCASETVAGKYWSGSGGQADFARGAMYSDGGQAFICTPSLTSKGQSRIVSQLALGSVVTTIKNTVDNVVTEHGVAELRGKTLGGRAREMIKIADPSFRDHLTRRAHEMGLFR